VSALTTLELERLLFEDAPYGDLTTEALGIGDVKARIRFAARGPMIVSAIEETATLLALVGGTSACSNGAEQAFARVSRFSKARDRRRVC